MTHAIPIATPDPSANVPLLVKRQILAKKLEQLQAQGYDATVNAAICADLDDTESEAKHQKQATAFYRGAAVVQKKLDALPEEPDGVP